MGLVGERENDRSDADTNDDDCEPAESLSADDRGSMRPAFQGSVLEAMVPAPMVVWERARVWHCGGDMRASSFLDALGLKPTEKRLVGLEGPMVEVMPVGMRRPVAGAEERE